MNVGLLAHSPPLSFRERAGKVLSTAASKALLLLFDRDVQLAQAKRCHMMVFSGTENRLTG